MVALCVLLVALINISENRESASSILDTFTKNEDSFSPVRNKLATEASRKNNLAIAPLAGTSYMTGIEFESSGASAYQIDDYAMLYQPEPTLDSQIVLASAGPQIPAASRGHQGTKMYEVKTGDTASSIAASFGVSTNTVLSANNLSDTTLLKPGDKLAILPVTGANYKVQKGDSLEAIAKKYNVDGQKIIAFNELTADGKLKDGQALIIPDGYLSPAAPSGTAGTRLAIVGQNQTGAAATGYAPIKLSGGGAGHRFPYGYCTWYVSQRRYIPWGGNAGSWLANARASGKATGSTPRPGAIMVSSESRWGHVAIVESVKGSSFTISEMNYSGFGRKSTRTLPTGSRVVRGFIY